MTTKIRQPAPEECSDRSVVELGDGRTGRAFWYPPMGGYVARALAVSDDDGCVDVYVWHDGQFPFTGHCQSCGDERSPVLIHHADGDDWVRFGVFLARVTEGDTP